MEKKTLKILRRVILTLTGITFLAISYIFIQTYLNSPSKLYTYDSQDSNSRKYHFIITGTYENRQFMEKVYQGALGYTNEFNCVIDFYVPDSQANAETLQDLLDYCSFVNADGVIAYIDVQDKDVVLPDRTDGSNIPLITTGNFFPSVEQISFIGNGYWELGKKIANETLFYLPEGGNVFIISEPLSVNANYSNLLASLQNTLSSHKEISTKVLKRVNSAFEFPKGNTLFISLTNEDTIQNAQTLADLFADRQYYVIGFGSNETSQMYLKKGFVNELISLDPEKIGEAAVKELFEYHNSGYANSYIAADVQISRYKK